MRASATMIAVRGGKEGFVRAWNEKCPNLSVQTLAEMVGETPEWVEDVLTRPDSHAGRSRS